MEEAVFKFDDLRIFQRDPRKSRIEKADVYNLGEYLYGRYTEGHQFAKGYVFYLIYNEYEPIFPSDSRCSLSLCVPMGVDSALSGLFHTTGVHPYNMAFIIPFIGGHRFQSLHVEDPNGPILLEYFHDLWYGLVDKTIMSNTDIPYSETALILKRNMYDGK